MPMNTLESIVNTYAWMNATNSSRQSINNPNSMVTTVIDPLITGPSFAVTNITDTNPRIIA